MDIVSQIYNSLYKGRDDSTSSVAASHASRQVKSAEGKAISAAVLNPGDVFSGEVTDVKNQEVTIRLAGGEQMSARLGEQIPINIGDQLQFMVKEASTEQLLLKVMPNQEQNQMSAIAERALTANGFSLSEKNGNIAMALMDAGEPLDKANIMKLMQQSYKFPEAKLETLVSMNKLGIPVTEGNVSQFESYLTGTHQMAGTVMGMADSAVANFAAMAEEADIASVIALNQDLIDMIMTGKPIETEDGLEAFRQMMKAELAADGEAAMAEAVIEGEMHATEAESDINHLPAPVNGNISLNEEQLQSLAQILTKAGYPPEQSMGLLQNATSVETLLSQLSGIAVNMNEAAMRELLKSESYQKLLQDGLKSAWSLHPEKMKEPREIDDLYEKILKDSAKLAMAFGDKGTGGQEFDRQSGQMQEQMKFIQDLNQNFIYSQMPVKLSDKVTNSELYVYADKKKLAEKRDAVSVLLHLDMENLGPTDVHVSLAGKKVHAVFTLQNQQSIRIVASNMAELSDKLSEKGLELSHEVKKKPEVLKSPVVKEMIDPDAEKSVKRYNFDVRM